MHIIPYAISWRIYLYNAARAKITFTHLQCCSYVTDKTLCNMSNHAYLVWQHSDSIVQRYLNDTFNFTYWMFRFGEPLYCNSRLFILQSIVQLEIDINNSNCTDAKNTKSSVVIRYHNDLAYCIGGKYCSACAILQRLPIVNDNSIHNNRVSESQHWSKHRCIDFRRCYSHFTNIAWNLGDRVCNFWWCEYIMCSCTTSTWCRVCASVQHY